MKNFKRLIGIILSAMMIVSTFTGLPFEISAASGEKVEVEAIAETEPTTAEPTATEQTTTQHLSTEQVATETKPTMTTETLKPATEPSETITYATIPIDIASGTTGKCKWNIMSTGVLTISGNGAMDSYTTTDLSPWYVYRESITSVVIEEGVTNIGNYCFYNLTNLAAINLPSTVNCINQGAFKNCTSLSSIKNSSKIISIEDYAFYNCSSLKNFYFSSNITTTVGSYAFFGTGLTEIILISTIKSVGEYAFSNCINLTEAYLRNNDVLLGTNVFENCPMLEKVDCSGSYSTFYKNNSKANLDFSIFVFQDYSQNPTRQQITVNINSSELIISGTEKVSSFSFTHVSKYVYDNIKIIKVSDGVSAIAEGAFSKFSNLSELYVLGERTKVNSNLGCSLSDLKIHLLCSLEYVVFNDYSNAESFLRVCEVQCVSGWKVDVNNRKLYIFGKGSAVRTGGGYKDFLKEVDFIDEVVISDGVQAIEYYAFNSFEGKRDNLKLTIDGVKTIGSNAFSESKLFNEVHIKGGTEVIGYNCFERCSSLKKIRVDKDLKKIDGYAFCGCDLEEAVFPDSLETISNNAFCWSSLTGENIYFGKNLVTIGSSAFYDCIYNGKHFVLPDTLSTIGANAFEGFSKVRYFYIGSTIQNYSMTDMINADIVSTEQKRNIVFMGSKEEWDYYFEPELLTQEMVSKTEVACLDYSETYPKISGSINEINWEYDFNSGEMNIFGKGEITCDENGKYPWENFIYTIESINIEEGITSIGESCFYGSVNAIEVNLPASLLEIKDYAFYDCGYESIRLHKDLQYLGDFALSRNYNKGNTIYIESEDPVFMNRKDFYTAFSDYTDTTIFSACNLEVWKKHMPKNKINDANILYGLLSIPDKLTGGSAGFSWDIDFNLGRMTIYGSGKLSKTDLDGYKYPWCGMKDYIKSINLVGNFTSISTHCFEDFYNLTDIELPLSLELIEDCAFMNCESLKSIIIPQNVSVIEWGCFTYCKSLESVILPKRLTEIAGHMFSCCENLKELTVPEGVKRIGKSAFTDSKIEKVVLPNGIEEISDFAFSNSQLQFINFPKSLTTIGFRAFGNSKIKEVVITKNLTGIDTNTFYECRSLTTVYYPEIEMPRLISCTFPSTVTDVYYAGSERDWQLNNYYDWGNTAIHYNYVFENTDPTESTAPTTEILPVVTDPTESTTPTTATPPVVTDPTESTTPTTATPPVVTDPIESTIPTTVTPPVVTDPIESTAPTTEILPVVTDPTEKPTKPIIKPKRSRTIKTSASSYKKDFKSKPFNLKATVKGGGKLKYVSENKKVAKVSNKGKVTIVGAGKTTITITVSENSKYKSAIKRVTVKVNPPAVFLMHGKSKNNEYFWTMKYKYSKYEVQFSKNSKFSKCVTKKYKLKPSGKCSKKRNGNYIYTCVIPNKYYNGYVRIRTWHKSGMVSKWKKSKITLVL